LIGDSTVRDMTHGHLKTITVANEALFRGAIVVPENLFVEIAEKMEWFDIDVSALQSALEQAPEVLQSVCVYLSIDVAFRVVNVLWR